MNESGSGRSSDFLIMGHRGSPRRWRENSIVSLRASLDEGADGFETDLRRLKDGAAVLFHDGQLGGVETESLAQADLRQSWPELAGIDELLTLIRGHGCAAGACRHLFDIEIKRRGWENEVIAAFANVPNVIVSSFDHELVAALACEQRLVLGIIFSGYLINAGKHVSERGAQWYFPEHRSIDRKTVNDCRDHGVKVIPWAPNSVPAWEHARECGCQGVITDHPEEAVAWRFRVGGAPLCCRQ